MSVTPLKRIIMENSISIKGLAQQCNISSSYLSLIVNGHRSNIDEKIISTLALKLNVTQDYIKSLLISQKAENIPTGEIDRLALLWLNNILDALEVNNKGKVDYYTNLLFGVSGIVPFAQRFIEWYKGWQLTLDNQFVSALELFDLAIQFQPTLLIEKRFKAKIYSSMGGALVAKGKYKEAMKAFRSSLLLWDQGKQVALVYLNMGTLYRRSHQYNRASEAYEKAIEYGANYIKISALSSLAQVSFDRNNMQKAREYILRGYWIAKSELSPRGKDDLYCNIGIYFSLLGKTGRAKAWLKRSLSINQETKNRRTKEFTISELINIYFLEGNVFQADHLLSSLEKEISDNNDALALANSLCIFAKRLLNSKELEKGFLILIRCLKILNSLPPSNEHMLCYSLLSRYYQATKDPFLVDFYKREINHIRRKMK